MKQNEIAAPVMQAARPEFIRMPKAGAVCPWSGPSRSYLYQLEAEGAIKTLCLRKQGKARGVRLIVFESLMEYLRTAANGEAA